MNSFIKLVFAVVALLAANLCLASETPPGGGLYENYKGGGWSRWTFSPGVLNLWACGKVPLEVGCKRRVSVDLTVEESEKLVPIFLARWKTELPLRRVQLMKALHENSSGVRDLLEKIEKKEVEKSRKQKAIAANAQAAHLNQLVQEIEKLEKRFEKDPKLRSERPDLVGLLEKYVRQRTALSADLRGENSEILAIESEIAALKTEITKIEVKKARDFGIEDVDKKLKVIAEPDLSKQMVDLFYQISTEDLPVVMDSADGKLSKYVGAATVLHDYFGWLYIWANVTHLSGKNQRVAEVLQSDKLPHFPEIREIRERGLRFLTSYGYPYYLVNVTDSTIRYDSIEFLGHNASQGKVNAADGAPQPKSRFQEMKLRERSPGVFELDKLEIISLYGEVVRIRR